MINQIKESAFYDELKKLASAMPKGRIKKATIIKLARIDHGDNGEIIYHSKDEDDDKSKINPRNGYEMYTEDSASGNQTVQTQPSPM